VHAYDRHCNGHLHVPCCSCAAERKLPSVPLCVFIIRRVHFACPACTCACPKGLLWKSLLLLPFAGYRWPVPACSWSRQKYFAVLVTFGSICLLNPPAAAAAKKTAPARAAKKANWLDAARQRVERRRAAPPASASQAAGAAGAHPPGTDLGRRVWTWVPAYAQHGIARNVDCWLVLCANAALPLYQATWAVSLVGQ